MKPVERLFVSAFALLLTVALTWFVAMEVLSARQQKFKAVMELRFARAEESKKQLDEEALTNRVDTIAMNSRTKLVETKAGWVKLLDLERHERQMQIEAKLPTTKQEAEIAEISQNITEIDLYIADLDRGARDRALWKQIKTIKAKVVEQYARDQSRFWPDMKFYEKAEKEIEELEKQRRTPKLPTRH